jgi:hypothetical protein
MSKKHDDFFARRLGDLPDTYVECRDMRHSWGRRGGYQEVTGSKNLVARDLECSRCGCVRTDVINVSTFDRVSTAYHYPDGYTVKGNKSTKRGMVVRREAYRRWALSKS